MNKLLLSAILISFGTLSFAQYDYFVLKKRNKTIQHFWKDSYITFQLKDGQWVRGIITSIKKDSFDLKFEKITYSMMGADTVHFSGFHYTISDIYAMPKKGLKVDYRNDKIQIITSAGHVHWYWIKSGWIFRTGAIGYTALYVANGLIENDLSLSGSSLGIAAGVFLAGVVLHKIYKPTFRVRTKYHLEAVSSSAAF